MKLNLVTGGALAALAAAIAFTAAPASARPNDDNPQWRGHHDGGGDSGQQHHGGEVREQHAPAPQAAPPAQAQAQVRQEHGSWGQWRQQQPQAAQQAQHDWRQARQEQRSFAPAVREQQQQQADARVERRGRDWQGQAQQAGTWGERIERNGSYADRNRNTTYRDAQRNDSYRDRRDGYRDGSRQDYRDGNRQAYRNDSRWDRNWRSNNRYDWQRYRQYNRNVYHVSPYYAPYRNYSYRRLNIGFYLDPLFFGESYWINDPFSYRLPDVYGPYRWVRYYDDALLVDVYTGEVVDVIYDFFW